LPYLKSLIQNARPPSLHSNELALPQKLDRRRIRKKRRDARSR
jgi:hypothetical protein